MLCRSPVTEATGSATVKRKTLLKPPQSVPTKTAIGKYRRTQKGKMMTTADTSDITGTWYNQLGSTMKLTVTSDGGISDGGIGGSYESPVGTAPGEYAMSGRYDMNPQEHKGTVEPKKDGGATLGWTVSWCNKINNSHSATTWSGQYFPEVLIGTKKVEQFVTIWIISRQTVGKDQWTSTLVGQDVFTRTKPPPEDVEYLLSIGPGASHPLG